VEEGVLGRNNVEGTGYCGWVREKKGVGSRGWVGLGIWRGWVRRCIYGMRIEEMFKGLLALEIGSRSAGIVRIWWSRNGVSGVHTSRHGTWDLGWRKHVGVEGAMGIIAFVSS
jgi:hypothetical protein